MKTLLATLSATLISAGLFAATPGMQNCKCENCKCTLENHCGCLSAQGCSCSDPSIQDSEKGPCGCNCPKK